MKRSDCSASGIARRRCGADPCLLDRFRDGATIAARPSRDATLSARAQARVEREVLELLS